VSLAFFSVVLSKAGAVASRTNWPHRGRSIVGFENWPLRLKMAVLFVVVSVVPLGVATLINISEARERLLANTGSVLAARSEQLVGRIDAMNLSYQRAVRRVAHLPEVAAVFQHPQGNLTQSKARVRALLNAWPSGDANIRGVALLDASGAVLLSTEDERGGANLAYRSFVRKALRGIAVTSDVFLADSSTGELPTIAFVAPVRDSGGRVLGLAAFWVHASALWNVMTTSNELAGPGSFAVLFDNYGIRVGHTHSNAILFRPGGPLARANMDAVAAERRFGPNTRSLLEDVRAFPEQFDRSLAKSPEPGMFRGFAPDNGAWNYGVARRFETVPWTVFYMAPEGPLLRRIAAMTRHMALFAATIASLALVAGAMVAAVILRPVRLLSAAAGEIAGGALNTRVTLYNRDELGILGTTFNMMAERIENQTAALQEQSRARQELLRGIIEYSDDAIISKTLSGIITSWNPGAQKLFGYSAEEAIGQPMQMLVPSERLSEAREILNRVARGELTRHLETDRVRKGGRHIQISATISPLRDRERHIVGASTIARDITERKIAQKKAEAQLERLNLLHQITRATGERQDLPSIFQVVVRTLEDQLPIDFGCICLYEPADNELVVQGIGTRSQELALALALGVQAHVKIDENGLSRCVRGQLTYEPDVRDVRFPFPQRLAQGGLRALVAAPLLVESKVFGVLIVARRAENSFSSGECEFLRQLSEHVALAAHQAQLYRALESAYEDLRQTQQAVMQQERLRSLGQMASGIAHDINNAISPIALYTDSLIEREANLSPQGRGQLETIQRAVEDVAATVARMREFYRQHEPPTDLTPVRVNDLVQQVMELTRARWSDIPQRHGIVIDMKPDLAFANPVIMGVESEIREALTNLVLNAVDAMPAGGALILRTRAMDTGQVQIDVSDTGTGMDDDSRQRCFEPFFTTKGERGTGLGLAMVYGAMQRHNAEIEVVSAPGAGTTMRLLFPAATRAIAEVQSPSVPLVPTGMRILIVDDDTVLLNSLREALAGDGHTIVTANGGREGVELFHAALKAEQTFATVITDLGMPYVDGRQVASAIKAASPSTPIVLLTGWGQRLVAEGDVPAHVDVVLNKPPKLRDLREALARYWRRPES
jgi:PAS domain S-box-containing protein